MKILKKNILNKEDDKVYTLSMKRIFIALIILIIILFIITFINGAMVHKKIIS